MNTNKLKAMLALRGKSQKEFALALGISKTELYRKIRNITEFTRDEIVKAMQFLELSQSELHDIFLTN